jgi:hypothetical protein
MKGKNVERITGTPRPILKNEFMLNRDSFNKLYDDGKYTWILGYGSLLCPAGWKGRGMTKAPKELVPVWLEGFERGPWGVYFFHNFYGIIRQAGSRLNAVIAPIKDKWDWLELMNTEMVVGLHRRANYRIVDVTEDVKHYTDDRLELNGMPVLAVVNRPINREKFLNTRPAPWYYSRCWHGCKDHHSEAFFEDFCKTGAIRDSKACRQLQLKHRKQQ